MYPNYGNNNFGINGPPPLGFDMGNPNPQFGAPISMPGAPYPASNTFGFPGGADSSPGYPPSNNSGYPNNFQSTFPSQPAYPGAAGGFGGGYPESTPTPSYPSGGQGQGAYPNGPFPGAESGHRPNYPAAAPQSAGYPAQNNSGYPAQGGYPAQTPSAQHYPQQNAGASSHLYPSLVSNPASAANFSSPAAQTHMQSFDPTVRPYQPFNPHDDAQKLYKAMKGFGTDEAALIDVLCHRTSAQRQEIAVAFKTGYGKDLMKNVLDETGGNFKIVCRALMLPSMHYEASELKNAIDGLGTDEATVIDIMCTKSNREMQELKMAYRQLYNRDLERDVGGDVSGYFKRILVSLSAANRSDAPPNLEKARQQAKELHAAGIKRLGTDEVQFNRIFAVESFPHLRMVFEEYQKMSGQHMEQSLRSEMSGSVERAFLAITQTAKYPPTYWAQRLYESMKGAGTKDINLIRIMVLRAEVDMVQIKQEFQRAYGKTLESFIRGDVSGDYKRALLCLAGDPKWK